MDKAYPSKICIVSATGLTIHFFMKAHLDELTKYFDVTLALNQNLDPYLPALNLDVKERHIDITRQISIWSDVLALFQLFKLFRSSKFDLVISVVPKAGLLGMCAAYLAGVPRRLHIFQGEVWASKSGLSRRILKLADKLTALFATNLLAVSYSERKFLEEQKIVSAGQVTVLGYGSICGVNTDRYSSDIFKRQSVRVTLGIPDDAVVAIFVGRIARDKGVYELCKAIGTLAQQCPNLWLLLVGPDEGKVVPELLDILGEMSKKTRVVGYVTNPESYMASADFICLPSHREGFGVVVIEAGSLGLPAIGSRIYGLSDSIQDGRTGILVEREDILELRVAIISLYENPVLRKSLGDRAKEFSHSNFYGKKVVGNYIAYIQKLFV